LPLFCYKPLKKKEFNTHLTINCRLLKSIVVPNLRLLVCQGVAVWQPPHTPRKIKGAPRPLNNPLSRVDWFTRTLKTGLTGSKRGSLIGLLRYARTSLFPTGYDLKLTILTKTRNPTGSVLFLSVK
jgi:hypothetical protein